MLVDGLKGEILKEKINHTYKLEFSTLPIST